MVDLDKTKTIAILGDIDSGKTNEVDYFNFERVKPEILKHKVIGIFGNTGSGKTSTAFKILEYFKGETDKKIYVYKHPQPNLIEVYGFELLNTLELLDELQNCVLFIDEPQLHLPKYETRSNHIFERLMSLCRQRDITLIFSTSDTRYINRSLEAYIDGWFIKDLRFDMVKNGSFIKEVIKRNSLITPNGFKLRNNQVLYSNRNNPDIEFKFNIEEASFFSEELSCAYKIQKIPKEKFRKSLENLENPDNEKNKPKNITDLFKTECRKWVIREIGRGNFKLDKCSKCGSVDNLNSHHKQYTFPFTLNDVEVLCMMCHKKEHRELGVDFFKTEEEKI
jgi:hypothetical protein